MRDRNQVPLCREGHGEKAVRRKGGYETLPGRVITLLRTLTIRWRRGSPVSSNADFSSK
jgi:hypothetical protein